MVFFVIVIVMLLCFFASCLSCAVRILTRGDRSVAQELVACVRAGLARVHAAVCRGTEGGTETEGRELLLWACEARVVAHVGA